MAIISFDNKAENVWGGAGWAFRQILRDLSAYAQGDSEFQSALEQAGHLGSLIVDNRHADLRERMIHAILRMCNEVINGTQPSSINEFHADRETQDLYRQELQVLLLAAKAPRPTSQLPQARQDLTQSKGKAAMNSDDSVLAELISEELEGVTFVRDYIQLQFGSPPTLNAYNPVTVRSQGTAASSGHAGFAQALVDQIDKTVRDVQKQPLQRLEILFDDASTIEISLRSEDYRGPEAFQYFGKHGVVVIE